MKALAYLGPNKKGLEQRPKPEIAVPTDEIAKIGKTTNCGTDLHILKGDLPSCQPGRILGHGGVDIVDSVGKGVAAFKPGDHVLICCISACGKCAYCRMLMYSHCTIVIDLDDNRLGVAHRFGATAIINSSDGEALDKVLKLTDWRGVNTAIEAVGIPATFELCEKLVAPGGAIAHRLQAGHRHDAQARHLRTGRPAPRRSPGSAIRCGGELHHDPWIICRHAPGYGRSARFRRGRKGQGRHRAAAPSINKVFNPLEHGDVASRVVLEVAAA
jgi:D-arabinose 1-dehydrogenase-like Zn-dependent alcohol dehydrogenase